MSERCQPTSPESNTLETKMVTIGKQGLVNKTIQAINLFMKVSVSFGGTEGCRQW